MPEVTIVYWRDIPAQVIVGSGRGAAKAPLSERFEQAIDRWNEEVGPLKEFILPGGSRLLAQAHVCRSQARTAERRCQQLNALEPLRGTGLAYLNRLSDLLFVGSRLIGKRMHIGEILWRAAERR